MKVKKRKKWDDEVNRMEKELNDPTIGMIMSVVVDMNDQMRTSRVRKIPGIILDLNKPDPSDGKEWNLDDEDKA